MTGKDFIKILLCSYGYDRNIKVETYNGDYMRLRPIMKTVIISTA